MLFWRASSEAYVRLVTEERHHNMLVNTEIDILRDISICVCSKEWIKFGNVLVIG